MAVTVNIYINYKEERPGMLHSIYLVLTISSRSHD